MHGNYINLEILGKKEKLISGFVLAGIHDFVNEIGTRKHTHAHTRTHIRMEIRITLLNFMNEIKTKMLYEGGQRCRFCLYLYFY